MCSFHFLDQIEFPPPVDDKKSCHDNLRYLKDQAPEHTECKYELLFIAKYLHVCTQCAIYMHVSLCPPTLMICAWHFDLPQLPFIL